MEGGMKGWWNGGGNGGKVDGGGNGGWMEGGMEGGWRGEWRDGGMGDGQSGIWRTNSKNIGKLREKEGRNSMMRCRLSSASRQHIICTHPPTHPNHPPTHPLTHAPLPTAAKVEGRWCE